MHCRRSLQPRAVSCSDRLLLVCEGGQRQAATRNLCMVISYSVSQSIWSTVLNRSFLSLSFLSFPLSFLFFIYLLSPHWTGTDVIAHRHTEAIHLNHPILQQMLCVFPRWFPLKETLRTNENKLRLGCCVLEGF